MDRESKKDSLFEVAVMAAIPYPLTYRFPPSLAVSTGQRVLVPLASRKATGIVLGPTSKLAPGIEVREALRAIDPEPALSAELVKLALWISDYYLAPPGEVFRAMLPLRQETRSARQVRLTEEGRRKLQDHAASPPEESDETQDATLLAYLDRRPGASLEILQRRFPSAYPRAVKQKWVMVEEVKKERSRRQVFAVRLAGPLPEQLPRLSPVAKRIIEALEQQGPADDHRPLLEGARAQLANLRKLGESGLIELSETGWHGANSTLREGDAPATAGETPAPQLTPAQSAVMADLFPRLDSGGFGVVLLHGVTGSGKTEIYLRLIARCLERGRTALMLVPEIALTPAVQAQFFARFGAQVALLHSALTENERHEEWWRIRRGEAKVVLGTRSAIFAPLTNLGVVIVDEEHDTSYKQEETPRYHGRDVAVVRARLAGALALLGSATPSLESYWNAREGKYRLAALPERVEGGNWRKWKSSTCARNFARPTRRCRSPAACNRKSRRSFEPAADHDPAEPPGVLVVSVVPQLRPDAALRELLHLAHLSSPRASLDLPLLRLFRAVPSRCPNCESEHLHYVGEGTEKVEKKFAELFPGARVARLDRDVARRRGQFQHILEDFRRGKIDILVGTQLIAKGHDFPGVTLVGVVSADIGLGLPDFRSAERTFQLLTQAAGRAGRGEAPGRVLVQTFLSRALRHSPGGGTELRGVLQKEMRFRRMMHYPPVTALANVIAQHEKLEQAAQVAKEIGDFFTKVERQFPGIKILGPGPAPLAKVERRFRIQFLLKSNSRANLHAL